MTTTFERQEFPFAASNLCVNSNSMRQQLWLQSEFQQPQFQESYISQHPFDSLYGSLGNDSVETEMTGSKRKHFLQMDNSRTFKKQNSRPEFSHEEQWLDAYDNMLTQDKAQDPFIQYLDLLGADCQGAFHLMDNSFRSPNFVKKESFRSDSHSDESESITSDFDMQDKKRKSKTRQKRTKWSTTELYHLWVGIQTHGNEWREVKHSVGSRTYPQVKDKGRRLLQTEQWVTGKTKRDTESAKEIAKDIATEVLRRYSMTGRLSN